MIARATNTEVHIPPPDDDEEPANRRWLFPTLVVAGLCIVTLLFLQTRPLLPAYEWTRIEGPPGPVNLDSLVALDDRFAVLSGVTDRGVSIWWSDESGEWASQLLAGSPTQLAAGAGRLAAYRVRTGEIIVANGDGWSTEHQIEFPAETRSRQASGRPSVIVTGERLLELSLFGDVWRSTADQTFTRVIEDPTWGQGVEQSFTSECSPPNRSSPDVPPFVVADGRHLALISSNTTEPFGIWPVCEPVLWSSADGADWSMENTSLATDGAYVYDLAWRDGTLLAVGGYGIGQPAVWRSDDGIEWLEVSPFARESVDVYSIGAGGAGWVMLGRDSFLSMPVGWTSPDGSCWEALEPPVSGSDGVVSDHGILLVDRPSFPGMWLGTPTGSEGVCQ